MSARPHKISSLAPGTGAAIGLPAWVRKLTAATPEGSVVAHGLPVETHTDDGLSLVSVRMAGVTAMSASHFERATADAYLAIADVLAEASARHPVRFWNFIPGIHAPGGDDASALDRYMVFNAGRFAACQQWFGGEESFPRSLATASGVGHSGDDLVIHALAAVEPGTAVENPRQVPAYRYSQRYGPRPPCFARATRVSLRGADRILVGGTASVRGEESVHVGDLRRQTGETLDNLAALLQAATGDESAGPHRMTDVRVYHVHPEDEKPLRDICRTAFAGASVEYVRADICRQDLLVEIEGVC